MEAYRAITSIQGKNQRVFESRDFLNRTFFLILEYCEVASTFATVLANQDDLQDNLDSGKYNRHVWLFRHLGYERTI